MNLPVYNSKEDLPTTLNAKDIAAYLHISLTCAYTLMNAEKFPSIKIGKRLLITKERFLQWLEFADGQIL